MLMTGVGGHAELQAAGAGLLQAGEHARADRLARGQLAREPAVRGLERIAVRAGSERRPGIEVDIDVTDQLVGIGPRIGQAGALVQKRPRVDERRLGVEDQSVEVEDEGADHRG